MKVHDIVLLLGAVYPWDVRQECTMYEREGCGKTRMMRYYSSREAKGM